MTQRLVQQPLWMPGMCRKAGKPSTFLNPLLCQGSQLTVQTPTLTQMLWQKLMSHQSKMIIRAMQRSQLSCIHLLLKITCIMLLAC